MIELKGLHILLAYTCNYECDHCFVWGSSHQRGVFTPDSLAQLLDQAADTGMIREIWFEGGEPFMFYPLLLRGVRLAKQHGFRVGIVSNAFWATDPENTRFWLEPLVEAGLNEIDVSSDLYHGAEMDSAASRYVREAAEGLELVVSAIQLEMPGHSTDPEAWVAGLPLRGGDVMYRGRAAEVLAPKQPRQAWIYFERCLHENFLDPGRVHVDPFGWVHICQGLAIGNVFENPLNLILAEFDPRTHPIAGPLVKGGPAELIKAFDLDMHQSYVDTCHACYEARLALRPQFPDILVPDQMYGVVE